MPLTSHRCEFKEFAHPSPQPAGHLMLSREGHVSMQKLGRLELSARRWGGRDVEGQDGSVARLLVLVARLRLMRGGVWYTSSHLYPVSRRHEKGATWSELGVHFWGTFWICRCDTDFGMQTSILGKIKASRIS